MAEKYRLTIEKIELKDGGEESFDTMLLVEGPKAIVTAALSFAPAALGEEAPAPAVPVNATMPYSFGEQQAEDEKPKRTRRTKAQMDADRAAEATTSAPAPAAEHVPGGEVPLTQPVAYTAPSVESLPEPTPAPFNPFAPK